MTLRSLIAWLSSVLFSVASIAQKDGKVICSEYEEYVLTHELTPAGPVPTALDPNEVYPYMSDVETSNR